jgi:hypothetical protein
MLNDRNQIFHILDLFWVKTFTIKSDNIKSIFKVKRIEKDSN